MLGMLRHKRNHHCVFCDMIRPETDGRNILFQNDQVFVIADIKPDADYHYLVIPKEHIVTPKSLTKKHIPLVQHMIEVATQILEERCFPGHRASEFAKEYRLGFHWPPFHSVDHLHMHILYPLSSMPVFKKLAFRPGIGFMPVESLLDRIANLPDDDHHHSKTVPSENMDCS